MQSNTLKRVHKLKKMAPVGRGSKRGKTSGRGTKGQKARSGRKLRPEIRDVIMRLPKLRGRGTNAFVSRFGHPAEVTLSALNGAFNSNDTINKEVLLKSGLIALKDAKHGIKILGTGKIEKALKLEGVIASKSAKEAIEKAGGSIK
jgi:large subunit ribosomal protein L15